VLCASKDQKKDVDIDREGTYVGTMGRTDQIGWYVPAVPTEDGGAFWEYCAVPPTGVDWWKKLPTYPTKK